MNILYTHELDKELAELQSAPENEKDYEKIESIEYLKGQLEGRWENELLVAESDFEEFAESEAYDTFLNKLDKWPLCHIDWKAAAEALKDSYTRVKYEGVDYMVKS